MDKYATQGIRQSLYEHFKQNKMQPKEDMDDFGCKIICLHMSEGFKARWGFPTSLKWMGSVTCTHMLITYFLLMECPKEHFIMIREEKYMKV